MPQQNEDEEEEEEKEELGGGECYNIKHHAKIRAKENKLHVRNITCACEMQGEEIKNTEKAKATLKRSLKDKTRKMKENSKTPRNEIMICESSIQICFHVASAREIDALDAIHDNHDTNNAAREKGEMDFTRKRNENTFGDNNDKCVKNVDGDENVKMSKPIFVLKVILNHIPYSLRRKKQNVCFKQKIQFVNKLIVKVNTESSPSYSVLIFMDFPSCCCFVDEIVSRYCSIFMQSPDTFGRLVFIQILRLPSWCLYMTHNYMNHSPCIMNSIERGHRNRNGFFVFESGKYLHNNDAKQYDVNTIAANNNTRHYQTHYTKTPSLVTTNCDNQGAHGKNPPDEELIQQSVSILNSDTNRPNIKHLKNEEHKTRNQCVNDATWAIQSYTNRMSIPNKPKTKNNVCELSTYKTTHGEEDTREKFIRNHSDDTRLRRKDRLIQAHKSEANRVSNLIKNMLTLLSNLIFLQIFFSTLLMKSALGSDMVTSAGGNASTTTSSPVVETTEKANTSYIPWERNICDDYYRKHQQIVTGRATDISLNLTHPLFLTTNGIHPGVTYQGKQS
ncbi:hypothetical protein M8J77_025892 [Diaphorina citri]|nr:hypothetical protein M8J77_025892 [Diaphorina citri]